MKRDRFKNKSKTRFIDEKEKHGKKEVRHQRKEKSRLRVVLSSLEIDEMDNLEHSQKMGE